MNIPAKTEFFLRVVHDFDLFIFFESYNVIYIVWSTCTVSIIIKVYFNEFNILVGRVERTIKGTFY